MAQIRTCPGCGERFHMNSQPSRKEARALESHADKCAPFIVLRQKHALKAADEKSEQRWRQVEWSLGDSSWSADILEALKVYHEEFHSG